MSLGSVTAPGDRTARRAASTTKGRGLTPVSLADAYVPLFNNAGTY